MCDSYSCILPDTNQNFAILTKIKHIFLTLDLSTYHNLQASHRCHNFVAVHYNVFAYKSVGKFREYVVGKPVSPLGRDIRIQKI